MAYLLTCSCGSQTEMTAAVWSLDVDCAPCGRRLFLPERNESVVIESHEWPAHIFCFLDKTWDNVVVVEQTRVQVGSLKKKDLQAWGELNGETKTDHAGMPSLKSIEFNSIRKVECNLHDTIVEIDAGTNDSPRSIHINLHDGNSCQRFLDLMSGMTRIGWKLEIRFYSRLRAILYPTIGFVGLAILLGVILWAAGIPELDPANAKIRPRRRPVLLNAIILAVSLIGWNGMAIVVAILALSCLIWLLLRLKTPPVKWMLRSSSTEVDRYPALDFDGTEPTLWVVRNQSTSTVVANETSAEPTPNQNSESQESQSLASNPIAWILGAFLVACAFVVGLVFTWSNPIAWFSNVCLLCIHLSFVALLSSWAFRQLTSPRIGYGFFIKLCAASLVLAAVSGAALMMNVAEHWILAASATGVSAFGALIEAWLVRMIIRRNPRSH